MLLLALSAKVSSQNSVSYQYDSNGNRTQRSFVGLRISHANGADSSAVPANQKLAMKYGLSIFPNPSRDVVHVVLNQPGQTAQTGVTLRLVDASGRQVAEKKTMGTETQLDMSGQAAGLYYLRISFSDHEQAAYTVVKTN